MEYVLIGSIVNTHGLKGEVRLLSDFKHKKDVLIPNQIVYLGQRKDELTISGHRIHKNYDLLTFNGLSDINDVIVYKNDELFIKRSSLADNVILNEDLIGLEVYDDLKLIGTVKYVLKNKAHDIISVKNENKDYLVPYVDEFIKQIDLKNNKIIINNIKGLIDED